MNSRGSNYCEQYDVNYKPWFLPSVQINFFGFIAMKYINRKCLKNTKKSPLHFPKQYTTANNNTSKRRV